MLDYRRLLEVLFTFEETLEIQLGLKKKINKNKMLLISHWNAREKAVVCCHFCGFSESVLTIISHALHKVGEIMQLEDNRQKKQL